MPVASQLQPVQQKLEGIILNLKALQKKPFTYEDVSKLQEQLRDIDEDYHDGKIGEKDGQVPEGQAVLSDLLNEAHEIVQDLLDSLPEDE